VRVAVTGANGFLGRHLMAALAADGCEPIAVGLERGSLPESLPFHLVDVRDLPALERLFTAVDPDAVVHLAALSHVGESWKRIPDYYAINIVGTENVARAAGSRRRFLFSSSAEVYGQVPDSEQPIPESRAMAPRSPYALTKAVAERIALDAGGTVVRLFNLVGPGQAPGFALPSFASQLAAIVRGTAPPVLRVGNLQARRDFVPASDAALGFRLLLERGERGQIYNLASGVDWSIAQLLDRLRAVAGVETAIELDPERLRPVDIPRLCGDARRLRALGWSPCSTVDRALAEVWEEAHAGGGAA
jgi:GDP-4-dehydro-6-deoxy-D-mannose reductase